MSIGISTFYGKESEEEILDTVLLEKLMSELINDADKKLYIAKKANLQGVDNER